MLVIGDLINVAVSVINPVYNNVNICLSAWVHFNWKRP